MARMSEALVRELALAVQAGQPIAVVARAAGVKRLALRKRLFVLGLLAPSQKPGRTGPRGRLVYRVRCSCGVVVEASQVGDTSDDAWLAFRRGLNWHAQQIHGVEWSRAAEWGWGAWLLWGERESNDLDVP